MFFHDSPHKSILAALAGILVAVGVILYIYPYLKEKPLRNTDTDMPVWKVYESEKFGMRFRYPETYYMETKELGDGHRGHFLIMLTEDTEENRLVREGKAPGREGPIAITFDLYQSPETLDPVLWMKGHSGSNYKLSDGTYQEITLAGKPAVSYSWDGLYRADNMAVNHQDYVMSIAVTYLTPEDSIRKDYFNILNMLEFF